MTESPEKHDPSVGHLPVLPDAVLAALQPQPGQVFVDGTIGRGGHAALIAPKLAPGGRYIGFDLDPANATFAADRLAELNLDLRIDVLHADFANACGKLDDLGIDRVDGVLADLGFASNQMDDPQRGFSFQTDAPLDMRLDPTQQTTAAELVNQLPQEQLANLLYELGEERLSRVIARKVVERRKERPIETTAELAEICIGAYGPRGRRQKIHPATRSFMALRIAVNRELERLAALLEQLPQLLSADGRAAIISFHSLEDRRVKQAFRAWQDAGQAELPWRKPVQADDVERAANPRSRSAKLRALRWI